MIEYLVFLKIEYSNVYLCLGNKLIFEVDEL
jgi:hypothetical protein